MEIENKKESKMEESEESEDEKRNLSGLLKDIPKASFSELEITTLQPTSPSFEERNESKQEKKTSREIVIKTWNSLYTPRRDNIAPEPIGALAIKVLFADLMTQLQKTVSNNVSQEKEINLNEVVLESRDVTSSIVYNSSKETPTAIVNYVLGLVKHFLELLINHLLEWRNLELQLDSEDSSLNILDKGKKIKKSESKNNEKKKLIVDFLFSNIILRALRKVITENPQAALHEGLCVRLETLCFEECQFYGRIISKEKKNLNAEILEDQYSQLLGELTLFRPIQIFKFFFTELEKTKNETMCHVLVRSIRYLKLDLHPLTRLKASTEILHSINENWKKLIGKTEQTILFCEVLGGILTPLIDKRMEIEFDNFYKETTQLYSKIVTLKQSKFQQINTSLTITLTILSNVSFFEQNFETILNPLFKLAKSETTRAMALELMYTVLLGYFTKIGQGNETIENKLQMFAKKMFSDKYLTLQEDSLPIFSDLLNLISTSRLNLATEILYGLLPSSVIDPKRQIIGLLAYTAIANRLGIHQEEAQVGIKVTSKKKRVSKFGTSRKLLKSFRQNTLSLRSRSNLLGITEETEVLRRAAQEAFEFEKSFKQTVAETWLRLLATLDKEIGEFITYNPSKQKSYADYQKDKPNHLDLAQTVYYSIRNTLQFSFELHSEGVEFFPMLIKHSLHYDQELSKEALTLLQSLVSTKHFKSRVTLLSSLTTFLGKLPFSAISESIIILNLLQNLLNTWKQENPHEINELESNELYKLEATVAANGLVSLDPNLREYALKILGFISSLRPKDAFIDNLQQAGFRWAENFSELTIRHEESKTVSLTIKKDFSRFQVFTPNPLRQELQWIRCLGLAVKANKSPTFGATAWEIAIDKIESLFPLFENTKVASTTEFFQKNFLVCGYCAIISASSEYAFNAQKFKTFFESLLPLIRSEEKERKVALEMTLEWFHPSQVQSLLTVLEPSFEKNRKRSTTVHRDLIHLFKLAMETFPPGELGKSDLLINFTSIFSEETSFIDLINVDTVPDVLFERYNFCCAIGWLLNELNLNHTKFKDDVLGKPLREKIASFLLSCLDNVTSSYEKVEKELLDDLWNKRSEKFKTASKEEFIQTFKDLSIPIYQASLRALSIFVASPYFEEETPITKTLHHFFNYRPEVLKPFARLCLGSYLSQNVTLEKLMKAIHRCYFLKPFLASNYFLSIYDFLQKSDFPDIPFPAILLLAFVKSFDENREIRYCASSLIRIICLSRLKKAYLLPVQTLVDREQQILLSASISADHPQLGFDMWNEVWTRLQNEKSFVEPSLKYNLISTMSGWFQDSNCVNLNLESFKSFVHCLMILTIKESDSVKGVVDTIWKQLAKFDENIHFILGDIIQEILNKNTNQKFITASKRITLMLARVKPDVVIDSLCKELFRREPIRKEPRRSFSANTLDSKSEKLLWTLDELTPPDYGPNLHKDYIAYLLISELIPEHPTNCYPHLPAIFLYSVHCLDSSKLILRDHAKLTIEHLTRSVAQKLQHDNSTVKEIDSFLASIRLLPKQKLSLEQLQLLISPLAKLIQEEVVHQFKPNFVVALCEECIKPLRSAEDNLCKRALQIVQALLKSDILAPYLTYEQVGFSLLCTLTTAPVIRLKVHIEERPNSKVVRGESQPIPDDHLLSLEVIRTLQVLLQTYDMEYLQAVIQHIFWTGFAMIYSDRPKEFICASNLLLEFFNRIGSNYDNFPSDMQVILLDLLCLLVKGFTIDSFIETTTKLILQFGSLPLKLFSKEYQQKQVALLATALLPHLINYGDYSVAKVIGECSSQLKADLSLSKVFLSFESYHNIPTFLSDVCEKLVCLAPPPNLSLIINMLIVILDSETLRSSALAILARILSSVELEGLQEGLTINALTHLVFILHNLLTNYGERWGEESIKVLDMILRQSGKMKFSLLDKNQNVSPPTLKSTWTGLDKNKGQIINVLHQLLPYLKDD